MVQVNKQSLERITNSPEETEKIGEELAKKILSHRPESEAVLLSLEGEEDVVYLLVAQAFYQLGVGA